MPSRKGHKARAAYPTPVALKPCRWCGEPGGTTPHYSRDRWNNRYVSGHDHPECIAVHRAKAHRAQQAALARKLEAAGQGTLPGVERGG